MIKDFKNLLANIIMILIFPFGHAYVVYRLMKGLDDEVKYSFLEANRISFEEYMYELRARV